MLKTSNFLKKKNGQAMIEFLPAILLFIVILFVSAVFFIGLRESTLLQESARNAAFAKIANSGPLVSRENRSGAPNLYQFPMSGSRNVEVNNAKTCFSATPQLSTDGGDNVFKLPNILGMKMDLKRTHKMTVFRRPGSIDACD